MPTNAARLKTLLGNEDVIGVAITITKNRNTHVGIVYRDDRTKVKMLHLRFHFDLACEDFDATYLCAIPDLELEDQEVIAGHCRSIARDRPPIWFSIHADVKSRFVEINNKVKLTNPHEGMNCSTFVLTVFNSAGPTLVNLSTWRKRPEDKPWHKQLVEWLKNWTEPKVPAWYIKKVEKDIGCARVRPEEVAGACLEDPAQPTGTTFDACEQNGKFVLQTVGKHTGRRSKW